MTAKDHFRQMIRERRAYARGSLEWEWRTRAARKLVWHIIGIPPCEWADRMKDLNT